MITQQLLDYIKQQIQMGKAKEEISTALMAQGWQTSDVENAFANVNSPNGIPIPASTELPKARQIFVESWGIYKNRFKTLIAIGVTPILTILLFGFLAGILSAAASAAKLNFEGPGFIIIIVLGIIGFLALIYICLWGALAQLFAIKDQAEGIGWQESFKRSKSKIRMFFGTSLLSGLAILGGFILFIVPGIIFALWFSQTPYIVVEEGLSNSAALKQSKYYVKGRIGTIFGKLFYIGIITIGLYILLGIILGVLDAVLGLQTSSTSWVGSFFSIFWTPVVTVFGYQLFKHIKATRP